MEAFLRAVRELDITVYHLNGWDHDRHEMKCNVYTPIPGLDYGNWPR